MHHGAGIADLAESDLRPVILKDFQASSHKLFLGAVLRIYVSLSWHRQKSIQNLYVRQMHCLVWNFLLE